MTILPTVPAAPIVVLLAVLAACTAGSTRPSLRPFPRAALDTLSGSPAVIVEAARVEVQRLGMQVRTFSSPEGYLETRWFDVGSRTSRSANTAPDRQVRLRIWTDLVTPRETQMVTEMVYLRSVDPSVPEREIEVVADSGSAGDSLARAVRAAVREQFAATKEP